jgi:hypothetical protein
MLRENTANKQKSVFDATEWMEKSAYDKMIKTWAPIFYDEVFSKIDESAFAPLYSTKGAPNFPVNILLSLEYIKHMKELVDEELLEGYGFDYLINYAVGNRFIGERPMADRTLYNFRSRIYQYSMVNPDSDDILFGQFQKLVANFAEKSNISLKEQRMDTTMFMSNIKKAGRLALAYDVLMVAVKAIPESIRSATLTEVMAPRFKTETLYRAKPAEGDKKLDQILEYCKEANEIIKDIPEASEVEKLVKRFLREQSELDPNGKIKAKNSLVIRSDSLQSAYDQDATYHNKAGNKQSGYVFEISETCSKDNPYQLITDCCVEKNNISDVDIIRDRIGDIVENTGCTDLYVDGGFNSPDVAEAATDADVVMHYTNLSGTKSTVKLSIENYGIDEETKKITSCPAGNVPIRASTTSDQTVAYFTHSQCAICEYRVQCRVKINKTNAVVRISLNSIRLNQERIRMASEIIENTSCRAGIEGSNSALKRKGLKKLNVRGIAKCGVVAGLMAAAQNIKRFIKYKCGGYDAAIKRKLKKSLGEVCLN